MMDDMLNQELVVYGLTIFLFLLISAFFSSAETALTAISRARIYQLVLDGNKRAKTVHKLREKKESLIGAILIGNNAVNIAASALATSLSIRLFGDGQGLFIVTIVMTLVVVIFSEILPKTYAIQNAERVSLTFAPALSFIVKLLYPITYTIQCLIGVILRLCNVDPNKNKFLVSASDVIRGTIELHHREGQMRKQERDMLGSILDLEEIDIEKIMIHRRQVETIDIDIPVNDIVAQSVSLAHSRIPLWRGEPDNIIGVLHVKNLIRTLNEKGGEITQEDILATCSNPWFVPETTPLRTQLLAFRSKRQHLAFVVDEYGDWQGIVTLEDIIEEIVGEIDDEHDESTDDFQKIAENTYVVQGDAQLRDINRHFDWNLPDDDASTIAGLLIHEAQMIPAVGESHTLHGFRFTVISKDATRISRLRIEKLPDMGQGDT